MHRMVLFALSVATAAVPAVAQQTPRSRLLVSVDWLAQHLQDPNLVLLHVGDADEYVAEHLPGARLVNMHDVSGGAEHDAPLHLEVLPAAALRERLQVVGISDDSRVIVYYGNDWVSPTTRIVFTLQYAGLGDRTAVLDGGLPAWKAAGHRLTRDVPAARAGRLSALRTMDLVVDAAWIQGHRDAPGYALVDGRAAVFYDGVEASGGRRGHIDGAASLPFTEIVNDDLHFRSDDELRALFAGAGVERSDTVVAYCHIGQQATAVLFGARLLGYDVRLYDGSMQDWGKRQLPVIGPAGGQ